VAIYSDHHVLLTTLNSSSALQIDHFSQYHTTKQGRIKYCQLRGSCHHMLM